MTITSQGLQLRPEDRALLAGDRGKAMQFAMELIVRAAEIEAADRLIDISFAHIDACFYNGRAHLDFVNFLLEQRATLAVPTWTNSGLVSLADPDLRNSQNDREMHEARELMLGYARLGCRPVWTCAPYQLPGRPRLGDHIVGSESNAVSFYNSVVGARSNKYGDFFDVCAALTGRVPYTGLQRTELRRGEILVRLDAIPAQLRETDIFYHLLGHCLGRHCGRHIPVIEGLPGNTTEDDLKAVSAACCSAGSVPLFHAVGITPEAPTTEAALQNAPARAILELSLQDLHNARAQLSTYSDQPLAAVALGTPHFSYSEFARLVPLLGGRTLHPGIHFYLTTSRHVRDQAAAAGWIEPLEEAGVRIITDTCSYFSPALNGLQGQVMTNSAKWAYYAPGMLPVQVVLGSLRECVESAIAGSVQLETWE